MEVSSQALKYDRVLGLTLNIACFLNIGRDHISPAEHPTFEDYFESKLRIFDQCKCAVVNLGTEHVDEVMAAAKAAPQLFTVGVDCDSADLVASNVRTVKDGIEFDIAESAQTRRSGRRRRCFGQRSHGKAEHRRPVQCRKRAVRHRVRASFGHRLERD